MVYASHVLFLLHVATVVVSNKGFVEASRKAGFIFGTGRKQFEYPSHMQNLRSALCSDLPPLVSSPSSFSSMNPLVESSSSSSTLIDSEYLSSDQDKFDRLCHQMGATPKGLLRLETTDDGVRGINVNRDIQRGGSLLSLPLSSCLCDHLPPSWFKTEDDDGNIIETQGSYQNPSSWATRLAASLLDIELQSDLASTGQKLWLSLLPNKDVLRASLPVHWNSDTVQATHCTALELAVDTAYFARAQAVADLSSALRTSNLVSSSATQDVLDRLCHDALDVVQTRSCRLENALNMDLYSQPLRILAPIFDFINHGSSFRGGANSANACFGLEMDENSFDVTRSGRLVVTTTRDLKKNEEVLIDYGSSAHPAWTCLTSYGFVPYYRRTQHDRSPQESVDDDDDEEEEAEDVENVAEVYMNGVCYEVGPSTIPYEMVEAMEAIIRAEAFAPTPAAATSSLSDSTGIPLDESRLTPEIAIRIAKRISDVAYQLLLQPVAVTNVETEDDDENDDKGSTPEHSVSAKLANSLRWSQHNILLACALGLRDWAVTPE